MRHSRLAKIMMLMRRGGEAASPLLTGLVAHWKMDETTGNREDSHGTYNMSVEGTVGYETGKLGNCATMATGASNYLVAVSDDFLAMSFNSFTITGWIYIPTAFAADCAIFSRQAELQFLVDSTGLYAQVAGAVSDTSSVDYNVTINPDTWYFVAARFDMTTDRKVRVKLNDGDWAVSGLALSAGQNVKNTRTSIRVNRTAGTVYGTCRYDSLSFWTRALSDAEIDLLYNEGNGLDYPFL